MNFELNKPGLIVLCKFKSNNRSDCKYHYWYIASDGINYLKNNIGVLSHFVDDEQHLLKFVVKKYKRLFEYTQDQVDLGFFEHWTALQIDIHDNQNKNHQSNFNKFFKNLHIDISYDITLKKYTILQHPNLTTQSDIFDLIIHYISLDFNHLFNTDNVAQCDLIPEHFQHWESNTDKLIFLEKARLNDTLTDKLTKNSANHYPNKDKHTLQKI